MDTKRRYKSIHEEIEGSIAVMNHTPVDWNFVIDSTVVSLKVFTIGLVSWIAFIYHW